MSRQILDNLHSMMVHKMKENMYTDTIDKEKHKYRKYSNT